MNFTLNLRGFAIHIRIAVLVLASASVIARIRSATSLAVCGRLFGFFVLRQELMDQRLEHWREIRVEFSHRLGPLVGGQRKS
jgi:hypothetical protein